MTNARKLAQLMADIQQQNICPELAKSATQLVAGHGNPNAEVVFIGEAPGKSEDITGLPFVGASGKFLDEMLASVQLKRDNIYITNIVKYRPPKNRDPKPDEKKAFWPFLVRELTIINPSIVITLGRHSMEYFLPNEKIAAVHGHPRRVTIEDTKLVVMPLYHPAAALYNGSLRQTLLKDFAKIVTVEDILSKEN